MSKTQRTPGRRGDPSAIRHSPKRVLQRSAPWRGHVGRLLGIALLGALVGCGDGGTGSGEAGSAPGRVLVVGWDGATFDLLDPLLKRGELPHLARLMARGQTARLESTKIPISSAAWPTIATGRGPGDHGVYSFFRPIRGSYDSSLISAKDVACPPLWRILSARGHRVHVWGVPVTFPPEAVNGTLVAGMLSPKDADYAHPKGLSTDLRGAGFIPDIGVWREVRSGYDIERIEGQVSLKEKLVCARLTEQDWSFSMIVFKSLDVLCHRPVQNLDREDVLRLLRRLDATLGKMVEAAGDETHVVLLSDHGFAEYRRTVNLHRWMIEAGYSVADPEAKLGGTAQGPLALFKASERAARLGQLDLSKTRAFATEAEGNFGSIRVNLAGREPQGPVTEAQRDALLGAIEADLMKLEFPEGVPVVAGVLRGEDLYPGPFSGAGSDGVVPDLIVEFQPDWRAVAATFGEALMLGSPPFPDHALDGVFVAAGPKIEPKPGLSNEGRPRLGLMDVAPMVLNLMGEPVPTTMTGSAHPEMTRSGSPAARIQGSEDPSLVPTDEAFEDSDVDLQSLEVRSSVKASGYGG